MLLIIKIFKPSFNYNEIPKWRLSFPNDYDDGLPEKPPSPIKKKREKKKNEKKEEDEEDEEEENMSDEMTEEEEEIDLEEIRRKWDLDCFPQNEYPKILPITQDYLKKKGYLSKKCMLNVEWKSVVAIVFF